MIGDQLFLKMPICQILRPVFPGELDTTLHQANLELIVSDKF